MQWVRDNAANMVAGIKKTELPAIGCTIHTLQLVIKDCIMTQHAVIDMLARSRKIVGHFKHSHLAVERLHSIQKQLNLLSIGLCRMSLLGGTLRTIY